MKLHASGEDYLETTLVLQKKLGIVRSVDVARHLEVSKPSVSHAVTTLKEDGFLTMDDDFFLHLTDLGQEVAEQTYEKHRFFMDLLTEAGVDPASAEQDACRMEHVISQKSFEHLRDAYNSNLMVPNLMVPGTNVVYTPNGCTKIPTTNRLNFLEHSLI